MRVDTGKDVIGAPMIKAEDNITRNLSGIGVETPKPTAMRELMSRTGAMADPTLLAKAGYQELIKPAGKAIGKTAGALGKTGKFLFGPVEMGLLPLAVAAEGLYQNYADKRDLKKALDQIEIPQAQKDFLLEGFRQESRDLGGV